MGSAMKTRIAPAQPPYAATIKESFDRLMPKGVAPLLLFTTLARDQRLFERFRRGALLDAGHLTLRQRELVILRTTALCGSEYEWGVHVAFFARAAGLTADEIAATVTGELAALPAADRPLLELCDALHRTSTIDDEAWARLAAARRPDQLVELVALAGQYH